MNPFLLAQKKQTKKKRPMTPTFLERLKTSRPLQISLIAIATAILITLIYLYKQLPSPNNLTSSENFPVSTQIFDRNGELLYEIYGNENRIPVQIDQLPEHLLQATVAIEDKKFYSHHGLDITGLIRASFNNFSSGSLQGGSTITQQLVKNALLTNEKTFSRKIKEAVLAIMTEVLYSKNEILEMYLNYISYGGTAVGVEAAANKYFDKSAKDLSLAEASLLAGLPQSPTTYSPFGSNPEKAKHVKKKSSVAWLKINISVKKKLIRLQVKYWLSRFLEQISKLLTLFFTLKIYFTRNMAKKWLKLVDYVLKLPWI